MEFETIYNGEKADVVREKVNGNFDRLKLSASSALMSLTTAERMQLTGDAAREGGIVYDITLGKWFQKRGTNWIEYKFNPVYMQNFTVQNWSSSHTLGIPFSVHNTQVNSVSVYMLSNSRYTRVLPEIEVSSGLDVTVLSDINFAGRVVIT